MAARAMGQLATWRSRGTRSSEQVVEKGIEILESGKLASMGDEAWSFLEQLALASLDTGRLDIADECLEQLVEEFPGSPRVECLRGIRIEVDGYIPQALSFYEAALREDETNVALWKRQISVLRSQGPQMTQKAVEELTTYLDIFYTDVEAWMELADIYSEINLYILSLQALSHVLILASQNPFYILRFAETAYTASDIPLALKMFLLVIDMDDSVSMPGNAARRAWWGVKLTTGRLIYSPNPQSESQTLVPAAEHLRLLDGLAVERLSDSYRASGKTENNAQGREVVLSWLGRTY